MKFGVAVREVKEIDVAAVRIQAAVRYEEEDIPNNFPFRKGDLWDVTIRLSDDDAEAGHIDGWAWHKDEHLTMKVCDEGTYTLLGRDGSVLATLENEYVPDAIGDDGDYLNMLIGKTGDVRFCDAFDPAPWFPDEA